LVRAHHGSLAREQRIQIEDQLKQGRLRGIVATSSLELGIDMGAVDLVVQVESPGAVSRGMQRVGRAGHQVGAPSVGKIFPKHRHDLLESAVVVRAMHDAEIETMRYLRSPLDVLAQQIVAHVAMHPDVAVADLAAMVRRAAPFTETSDAVLHGVLDLLAGRYPSEEFRELRPRIVWDRVRDTLRAREGAQRLAVTNAGTIPDRGLFGVFMPDGTRVGELDEEMVYETRPGETFLLGASTWRIEDITFDRVVVTPAPGQPGKMPYWHGDRLGRPVELGRAVGAFVRELRALDADAAGERLRGAHGLDELAAANLLAYLAEQGEATGTVPDDRTILVEKFRDDIGDWRVCIHTPFGTPVHAPWAMAIERRLTERWGMPVDTMYGDDGIVLRLPEAIAEVPMDELFCAPETVHDEVVAALPDTSLFAARFRECAARALLLPRRRPGERTPLWQQRQRAADLLAVAARHPTFPILLETSRECLQDVFDVPALRDVLARVRSRAIRVVSVETPKASPFAQGLLFNWIAAYMYEGDAPLAERRAAALALDRDLLNELLGAEELRELLDPSALADLELSLQGLAEGRGAGSTDALHDVLRRVGDLSETELALRVADGADAAAMSAALVAERRAAWLAVAGERRLVAAEDASRYRDALGCALPPGLPAAFTESLAAPLVDLVARYARSHGPFLGRDAAARLGIGDDRVAEVLAGLERDHRVVRGEFRPGGTHREWCDVEVLRQLRRRSLAALRREVEPVEQRAYVRFLAGWHGIPGAERGADHLHDVVHALQGASIVASTLLADVLPARVRGFHPGDLDAMCTSGELVWVGAGAVGAHDGRVRLLFADQASMLLPAFEPPDRPEGPLHDTIRATLAERGACFWPQIRVAAHSVAESDVVAALWDLVWAGEVTNDGIAPLRAMLERRTTGRAMPRRPGRARLVRPRSTRAVSAGPPQVAGRWGLVGTLLETGTVPSSTQVAHATALQLLERHGVLTREAVLAETVRGGFAGVYGVLKVLEERGTVRRGYFIDGLGAAQFAVPGAVDRLRAAEPLPEPIVLAATDPAQPFGATLDWPETAGRPTRATGAVVVIDDGEPLAWLDLRGHHLVTFPASLARPVWVDALVGLVKDGRTRAIDVRKIDGAAHDADDPRVRAVREALCARGFVAGYRGLGLRDLTRPGR
jgi:ATP-dependent Lhr-like helicase